MTIAEFKAVGKDLERTIQVTNASNATVTLTLTTREGTGSATFSNGSATMNITSTQNVTIKGVTESSKKDNIRLKATWTEDNRTYTLDEEDFCVLWVTLAFRNGNNATVTLDNAARPVYVTSLGTGDLNTFFSDGIGADDMWRTGIEMVGTVTPSNFDAPIVVKRAIIGKARFNDQTRLPFTFNSPDTSSPDLRDDDPQSGGSGGKIYDLDAPGMAIGDDDIVRPVGYILRDRTNFRQWASFTDGQTEMKVSANLEWFSRLSLTKQRRGRDELNTDVANDNTAGLGLTNLSWDLNPIPLSEETNNMKKTAMPLIAAFILTPLCNTTYVYGQTEPAECSIEITIGVVKKNDDIEKLLAIIRDKNLIKTDSAKVIAAIDKISELKASEAVDDLAELLTLDRGPKYFDRENPPSGGIISAFSIYPAVNALSRIGMPSVPAMTKVIENEERGSRASDNAWLVILSLYRENLSEAANVLRKAAGEAANQDGAARLLEAAWKFEELRQKLNNSDPATSSKNP